MAVITLTKENFNRRSCGGRSRPGGFLGLLVYALPDAEPHGGRNCQGAGGEIKVGKVNIDEQPELANQFRVMSIPTLLVFREGRLADSSVGVQSKQAILNMVEKSAVSVR